MALIERNRIHLPARLWGLQILGSVATFAGVVSAANGKPTVKARGSTMIIAEVDWNRIVDKVLEPAVLFFLLAMLVVSLIVFSRIRKTRLKEKMLERGFTASQMEEVMKS